MLYIISYDLKLPGRDYTAVYETIKGLGPWCHYLDSTWVVQSNLSIKQVVDRIKENMDNNDYLFVVDITHKDRNGWLPSDAWKWLREHDR